MCSLRETHAALHQRVPSSFLANKRTICFEFPRNKKWAAKQQQITLLARANGEAKHVSQMCPGHVFAGVPRSFFVVCPGCIPRVSGRFFLWNCVVWRVSVCVPLHLADVSWMCPLCVLECGPGQGYPLYMLIVFRISAKDHFCGFCYYTHKPTLAKAFRSCFLLPRPLALVRRPEQLRAARLRLKQTI